MIAVDARAQSFPEFESQWFELTRDGKAITDTQGEGSHGQPSRDMVGSLDDGALYIQADANYIYFRMRVDGTPLAPVIFRPYGWACQISTDHDPNDYEYLVLLDGKDQEVQVWANDQPGQDDPDDRADTLLASFGTTDDPEFADVSEAPGASTTFGGTADFFVDFAVPRSALPFDSTTTPMQLICGSNADGSASLTTGAGGDIAGFLTDWDDSGTDPVVCGITGCGPCNTADACGPSCAPCSNPTPVCSDEGMCVGCEKDEDCDEGEVCTPQGTCEPPPDAGVPDAPEVPDASVPDAPEVPDAPVSEPDAAEPPDAQVSEPDAPVSSEPDAAVSEPDAPVSSEPDAPVSSEPDAAESQVDAPPIVVIEVDAAEPPPTADAAEPPPTADAAEPPPTADAAEPPPTIDAAEPPPVVDAAVAVDASSPTVDAAVSIDASSSFDARVFDAGATADARPTDARPTDARPTDARPTDGRFADATSELRITGYIEGGGCDCRTGTSSSSPSAALWLLAILGAFLIRRRRP